MKKTVLRRACVLLTLCLRLKRSWVSKNNKNNKINT